VPATNQLKDVIAFTMLVLVLIFRPVGHPRRAPGEAARMTAHRWRCVLPTARRGRVCCRLGLIGGIVAIYLSLVGIVTTFHRQQLVSGVITIGQASCC
jgi:hypothetical protein